MLNDVPDLVQDAPILAGKFEIIILKMCIFEKPNYLFKNIVNLVLSSFQC